MQKDDESDVYSEVKRGWPRPRSALIVFSHSGPPPLAENCAKVTGISKIELAKIGGITPETLVLTVDGDDSPPVILFPT